MTSRREFSKKVRYLAFERANGCCEQCGIKLSAGKVDYDHILPDALGGEPTLENCAVLCRTCHGAKTAQSDVPRIAKTKRQKAFHIGANLSKNPLPGGRNSRLKKPFNGPAEPRQPKTIRAVTYRPLFVSVEQSPKEVR